MTELNRTSISLSQFVLHFSWYFLSTVLVAIIALVKSPIYTARFSASDFGYYSIAIISYTYVSMLLFTWMTACIWRYYNTYKVQQRLSAFYSNLLAIFLISTVLLLLFTIIYYHSTDNFLLKKIIILCFFQFTTTELLNVTLTHLRIEQKARKYNIIVGSHALLGFLLLLLLTFYFNLGIESFLYSIICMNLVFLLAVSLPSLHKKIPIALQFDKSIIRSSASFVGYLVLINGGILLLNNLDRFFVQWYKGIAETGYYNQAYNIAQLGFTALLQIFFSTVNPVYVRIIEGGVNKFEKKGNLMLLYLNIFIPLTVYFILFSKEVANILLSGSFSNYYHIIMAIVLSNFLYGLVNFSEIKLKFEARYKQLIIGFSLAIATNCVLNVLLLPHYATQIASVTTLAAYLVLFVYFYSVDMKHALSAKSLSTLKYSFLIVLIQVSVHFLLKAIVHERYHVLMAISEAIVFALTYYLFSFRRMNSVLKTI